VPQFVVAALTGSGAAHISLVPATNASVAKNIPVTPVPQTASQPLQQASMTGDFAVTAGWIQNLKAAFRGYGGQIDEGTSANTNSAWQIGALWPAPVPQFVVAALTGRGEVPLALASATSELAPSGNESAGLPAKMALDFPTIIFAPNSTTVPWRSIPFLRRVAEQIKQLPAGTVVLIDGYTQGAARPALNAELSQMRANSVYRILVREGVRPAMLSAKGYGSSPSLAGINGVTEGRSSKMTVRPLGDRRVEFRVVQQSP
jgi:outer membrane protein OmpA-like peptidoglycan-associated protein